MDADSDNNSYDSNSSSRGNSNNDNNDNDSSKNDNNVWIMEDRSFVSHSRSTLLSNTIMLLSQLSIETEFDTIS